MSISQKYPCTCICMFPYQHLTQGIAPGSQTHCLHKGLLNCCLEFGTSFGMSRKNHLFFPRIDIFIPRHTIVAGIMVLRWSSVSPSVCLSVRPSVRFPFPDDNLSKHQWIFTHLGMCIDIVEVCFGIANGQISSIFDGVICPRHAHIFVSG